MFSTIFTGTKGTFNYYISNICINWFNKKKYFT